MVIIFLIDFAGERVSWSISFNTDNHADLSKAIITFHCIDPYSNSMISGTDWLLIFYYLHLDQHTMSHDWPGLRYRQPKYNEHFLSKLDRSITCFDIPTLKSICHNTIWCLASLMLTKAWCHLGTKSLNKQNGRGVPSAANYTKIPLGVTFIK